MQDLTQDQIEAIDEVYGSFILGDSEFALPASAIEDVINAPERITPQPLAPPYLLGIITLRGMTVPVIDLKIMFNFTDEQAETPETRKVAILEYKNHQVGLLFDETGEVFRRSHTGCQYSAYTDDDQQAVTAGAFRFAGGSRIIQLLNASKIIELDGIPLTRESDQNKYKQEQLQSRGKKRQAISFRVGSTELALDISAIQEIVLVEEIEHQSLASGVCIGNYNLRGQTVPLINLASILHPDTEVDISKLCGSRFLIARAQGQLFGLAVDEICNIIPFYDDEILTFPIISLRIPELFLGCIHTPKDEDVFLVDINRLLSEDEVREATRGYSDLFSKPGKDSSSRKDNYSGNAETFLTFHIDKLYAVRILDIIEVVNYPEELLRPPMLDSSFDGVLNLRGELISIVNTRKLYQLEQPETANRHVIIFEHNGSRFGLAIQAIEAISHVYPDERQELPKVLLDQQSLITADVKEVIFRGTSNDSTTRDLSILDMAAVAQRIAPGIANTSGPEEPDKKERAA